ncbi:MAG TPA: hypothetical protein VGL91_16270 [Acidobacteriota bacterium]|jgi:hypothetical protein
MFSGIKILVALLAGFTMCFLQTAVATTVLVYSAGTVQLQVHRKDAGGIKHIFLPVPVSVLHLGLYFLPKRELCQAASELKPWRPALAVAASELQRIPDTLLLKVEKNNETVEITKQDESLVVDVDTRRETVHLAFPLRAIGSLLERIGNAECRMTNAEFRMSNDEP